MADNKPDQEPSIEEILTSIRQIIADDEDDVPAPKAAPAPAKAAVAAEPVTPPRAAIVPDDRNVLDLVEPLDDDVVEEEDDGYEPPPRIQVDMTDAEDELPPPPPEVLKPVAPSAPQPKPVPRPEPVVAIDTDEIEEVLTQQAASAALEGFAKLSSQIPVNRPSSGSNVSLEDIVRELMKPMLREWLDANLPRLIEKVVQKELDKIAQRALNE